MPAHETREGWLRCLAEAMFREFRGEGLTPTDPIRVTCGFPSSRGLSTTRRTLGEAWASEASADGTREVIVSLTVDDPVEVAGILAHELIHAVLPRGAGHKAPFKRIAVAIGLEGPMRSTSVGPEFRRRVLPLIEECGEYPHAKLDPKMRKKDSTRLLRAECLECGYIIRLSQKWIDHAEPCCPDRECPGHLMPMAVS